MGLALGGNLAEQHKITPFTTSEIVLMLRQMLDALVFLHVGHGIIHHDVKMDNILCDSREHFRLGDFGIAKEGCYLGPRPGTKPFLAPEMFVDGPYTAAVDVYALGLVIARLLTGGYPRSDKPKEGPSWCALLIAHFKRFEERTRLEGVTDLEQVSLTVLVRRHMLRMRPEKRESAPDCLERGDFLWLFAANRKWMLNHGINSANTVPQGQQNKVFPEDEDSTEDIDTEAVTKIRSLKTAEWLSLEREHAINNVNAEAVTEARSLNTAECLSLELEKAMNDVNTEAVTEVRSLNTAECLSLELEKAINENNRGLVSQHGNSDSDRRSESEGQQPRKKPKLSP